MSKLIKSLESAVAYAKGDESRGRKVIVRVPASHPDCARRNANREATKERMRKRRIDLKDRDAFVVAGIDPVTGRSKGPDYMRKRRAEERK